MSFRLTRANHRKAISLTPMIDVVFLLLVFFMLAARFDQTVSVEVVPLTSDGPTVSDGPRLIDVFGQELRLNGVFVDEQSLASALRDLGGGVEDLIVVRPSEGVSTQQLIDVLERLRAEGFNSVAVTE